MSTPTWDTTVALPETSIMAIRDFAPFVEGLDHPEGVACGPDGSIYAGGEAGQIYRVTLDGTFEEIGNTGGFNLGLCLDANSNVYVCDSALKAVMKITSGGNIATYSSGAPDRPMQTPNYPVFDAAGNLYVSDSGAWNQHNGCIFRVQPGGETEIFTSEVNSFPNGMAMHPSGSHLYSVVSQAFSVVRIAIEQDGSAGPIETVVECPHNVLDGLAFDEEENLFISCYTPDVIYRVSPSGALEMLAADWERVTFASPTNMAFCGPDRKTLVIGSLARWHLTKGAMAVAGARLAYPASG
ncbi:SMP-30/gluconolactonase/LRE family protein [soil metagenome]